MSGIGHNENAVRLGQLAKDATQALERITRSETDIIAGWLIYGAALNEGRGLFPSNREFGEWLEANSLRQVRGADVHDHEREAAMWAAANDAQFEEARAAGNAGTIRSIHAKWKEIEAERAKACEPAETSDVVEVEPAEPIEAEHAAPAAAEADEATALADDDNTEATPDPYGYIKLTDDALLETANGLRADLDDARAEAKALKAERDDLKAENQRVLDGANLGPEASNLKRQIETLRGVRDDEKAKSARLQRQANAQKGEIADLKKQLGDQWVTIGPRPSWTASPITSRRSRGKGRCCINTDKPLISIYFSNIT